MALAISMARMETTTEFVVDFPTLRTTGDLEAGLAGNGDDEPGKRSS